LNFNSERILKWIKFLADAVKHCPKAEYSLKFAAGSFKKQILFEFICSGLKQVVRL
jgi:hypothetical protein